MSSAFSSFRHQWKNSRNGSLDAREDAPEVIEKRLANALEEITHWNEYDYVVINDDLERAFTEVKSILIAERLRQDRRHGLYDFTATLTDPGAARA